MKIKIIYHNPNLQHIEKIEQGDWIDLSSPLISSKKGAGEPLLLLNLSFMKPLPRIGITKLICTPRIIQH